MVVQDEDESVICVGLSGHGSLDLNGTNLYELVDITVLDTLFKVVPV